MKVFYCLLMSYSFFDFIVFFISLFLVVHLFMSVWGCLDY